jgi:serine/threonine-protein kinase
MSTVGKESYQVLARLPDRGANEVFLARVGERMVVLERLPRARAVDPDVVGRFLEQARIGSQLGHSNIAQIVDVGRLGSTYYVAMEYADGELLNTIVDHARAQGKLQVPLRAVLTIAAGVVTGLAHAHERKDGEGKALEIVHGNLSPSRILVTREGSIKLLDFGLPSAASSEAAELPYRSPEQVREETIDPRSDLFSLGAILWELLTREPLFKRFSSADTISAIETDYPAPPSSVRLDVPPELDSIVLKLLAKAPSARFQTADDVLVEIEALATKLGFQISTTDLSRMMRLWFGPKQELGKLESDIVVAGVHLETDVAPGAPNPIDDLLDKAVAISPSSTPLPVSDDRNNRATVKPGDVAEAPRESFEQIRDRILGSRDNKDTKNPRSKAYTSQLGSSTTADATSSSAGLFGMSPTAITDVISRVTKASAAAGAATRESIAKAVNREAPDKVVVDMHAIETQAEAKAAEPVAPAEAAKDEPTEPAKDEPTEPPKPEDLKEAPRVKTPTARPVTEPNAKTVTGNPTDLAGAIAMARTTSTEWYERGEREASDAHAKHTGHRHDDHDDHKSTAHSHSDLDSHDHPRRPAWLIPALAAAILIVVVLAVVKMAGRETPAKTYGNNVGSTGSAVAAAGSAEVGSAVAPVVVDAAVAVVPVDAAEVAAVPVDAAQVAVVAVDAAHVAALPVDAPVKAETTKKTVKTETTKTAKTEKTDKTVKTEKTEKTAKTDTTEKTEKTKTDDKPTSIDDLYASGDFTKANQACAKNTQFNSQVLEMCANAACQVKDAALATRWLHALPHSSRDTLAAKCKDLGVEIKLP